METKPLNQFPEDIQVKALQLFAKLANDQRGLPETMSQSLRSNPGLFNATGAYTWMAEHVGDLTHRMAQKHCQDWRYGEEWVSEKVRKSLYYFNNGYGFDREVQGNVQSNFRYRQEVDRINIPFEEFKAQWIGGGKKYAQAHAALTVWNECQWHAREAAVSLGNMRFALLEKHLNVIVSHLKDGTWEDWASMITVNGENIMPYTGEQRPSAIREAIETNYLQQRYDYFNKLLFDGQLPKIPILIKPLKGKGGKVTGKLYPTSRPKPNPIMVQLGREDKLSNYDLKNLGMTISSTYKKENHQIDKILIHEMIHVYFCTVAGRPGEGHGSLFKAQVARCSKIVGFEVPMKDNVEGLDLAINVSVKPVGVLLIEGSSKGTVIALIGVNYINIKTLDKMIGYKAKQKQTISVYTIADQIWSEISKRIAIQRPNNKIALYPFSDEAAVADLKKNGKLVANITGEWWNKKPGHTPPPSPR